LVLRLLNVLELGPWPNTYVNTNSWVFHPHKDILSLLNSKNRNLNHKIDKMKRILLQDTLVFNGLK